jgi:hypothetical protein
LLSFPRLSDTKIPHVVETGVVMSLGTHPAGVPPPAPPLPELLLVLLPPLPLLELLLPPAPLLPLDELVELEPLAPEEQLLVRSQLPASFEQAPSRLEPSEAKPTIASVP